LRGPGFLWKSEEQWPVTTVNLPELPSEFSALKSNVNATKVTFMCHEIDRRFSRCSLWSRLTKAVVWILHLKANWRKRDPIQGLLTVDELQATENAIFGSIK